MESAAKFLEPFTWEMVTAQNALLCKAKDAFHGPTSDGNEATRKLWEENHRQPMTLGDALDLCRRCHRMAPFCFYNGNTFSSVVLLVIKKLGLPPDQEILARSLAGHIVAGVATSEEEKAFRELCQRLG